MVDSFRCIFCGKVIKQNERRMTDGKSFAHNHSKQVDAKKWKEVKIA